MTVPIPSAKPDTSPRPVTYEELLRGDSAYSLHEAEAYFGGRLQAKESALRLGRRLERIGVPYAVIGAVAMNAHKYERFTVDLDLIVRRESIPVIHEALVGLGYVLRFAGSKNLIDTENRVRIDLVIAGGFPGDGLPKPIDFPDPGQGTVVIEGIHYVTLEKLIELKLASGITRPTRLSDLGDVQKMIHVLKLPREFGDRLHPYVRSKFDEFWVAMDADELKDEF